MAVVTIRLARSELLALPRWTLAFRAMRLVPRYWLVPA